MLEHFSDTQKMQEVLQEAQTGLWAIELDEGCPPRMYADGSMLKLLGFDAGEPTPEECYRYWYDRIADAYYPVVQAGVERIIQEDRAEVQYPWDHPQWGRIYVRCGGVRDLSYQKGVCLRGYHQNITNTVMLKREYSSVVQSLSESYRSIFLCNPVDGSYKVVKCAEEIREAANRFSNYEALFRDYAEREVGAPYKAQVLELVEHGGVLARFARGEKQIELLYRNRQNGWMRVKVLPSAQYTPESPWMIAAFDEQDQEMERRIDDLMAQVAVSQIYSLVISVDLAKAEYNCIHDAGRLLALERHGGYEDFRRQLIEKMPREDRRTFDGIFDLEYYETKTYQDGIFRLMDADGTLHYYSYYAVRIREDMEEHVLLTVRNIDDRREAQRRDEVLSNLCQCYYSIYLLDLENRREEPVWQETDVYQSGEVPSGDLGTYYEHFIQNYVYEEDQDKMRRAGSPEFLNQVLSKEQPVYDIDFRRIYTDHLEWVRSRFSVAEIRDGRVTKVVFANMNINEQKIEELEEEDRKRLYFEYQNIVRGLSAFYHSVFYIDLAQETFQVFKVREDMAKKLGDQRDYEALRRIYGKSVIYQQDQARFRQDLSIGEIRRRILAGETIYALEYQRDYGGYYTWMRMHVILAESRNGVPVKVVLAAHSVEEEKEQEEKNKLALLAAYEAAKNANEAKSSFLAQMSHDIRTPMNAIIGMAAIAADHVHDPEKIQDCLNKIDLSSRHLLTLINDILDMSKIERGAVELTESPFSLQALMKDLQTIIRPEAGEKRQRLSFCAVDVTHDHLVGDTGKLRQVLLNLINNAVKYTPEGGSISVQVQEVSPRVRGCGSFIFTVEDNGIGIRKEFLDHIFVPFSRADDAQVQSIPGTGLGMPIAQRLVTAMGGNIQVESALGKGSRFTATLNLTLDASAQTHQPGQAPGGWTAAEGDGGDRAFPVGKHLLLVEDNALNMEIAQTILEGMGFVIRCAVNGQEAVDLFRASAPGTYHAILMDLQMPVMDGFAATREIRACGHPQASGVPIIALTANAFAEDVTKALTAGMNDHVSKPIDYDRLVEVLRRTTGR